MFTSPAIPFRALSVSMALLIFSCEYAPSLLAATTNAAPTVPAPAAAKPVVVPPAASLLTNGDFEKEGKAGGWPEGWGSKIDGNGITWEVDSTGKHFLQLVSQEPGQLQALSRDVTLKPDAAKALELSLRYKSSGIKAGTKTGSDARTIVLFTDKFGRPLQPGMEPITFAPDAKEWTEIHRRFVVPEAAAKLEIIPGLLEAAAGTLDLAEIEVRPLSDADAQPLLAAKKAAPAAAASLLPNGDFSKANDAGDQPAGWGLAPGMTWEKEKDARYLELVSQKPGQMQMLYATAPLKDVKGLTVSLRYRTKEIKNGEKPWYDARVIVNFLGTDGKPLKAGSGPIVLSSKAAEWTEAGRSFVVPEGAVQLQLMAGLFMSAAGTVDVAEIHATPIDNADLALLTISDAVAADKKEELVAEEEKKIDEKIDAQLAATGNLVVNGTFADTKGEGWPEGWGKASPGLTYGKDGQTSYLRLTSTEPDKLMMLYRMVLLKTGAKAVEVSFRYRTSGVKAGSKMPGDARAISHFLSGGRSGHLEFGTELKPDASAIVFSTKAKDWTEVTKKYLVPEGATKLQMMPGLWGVKEGTLDLAEIKVKPLTDAEAEAMAAEEAALAKKKADQEAILAQEMALPPSAKELKVAGNKVVTPDGKPVWLQGLCVDSMQWSMGDNILWSIHVAIDDWHANVIRLPVFQTFWFGHGKGQPAGGEEAYRQLVDQAVKLCAAKGVYLVLDLHAFGAPTQEHLDFWKDAAVRYKNNPAVLYELFNEPHNITWEIWRNGGSLKSEKNKSADVNPTENNEKVESDVTTGMQVIVDAVRATGAKNVIVSGGLDWSYDLTGIVNGYALDDKGGNGVMYVSHIYPWKKDWQDKVLIAADKVPIIITEIGCPQKWEDFSFIPESQRYPLDGWSEDVLGMIQKYKLNWTGFSFHPHCGPMVIQDWNYTPTPYWGVYVKEALAGKQFTLKKMR